MFYLAKVARWLLTATVKWVFISSRILFFTNPLPHNLGWTGTTETQCLNLYKIWQAGKLRSFGRLKDSLRTVQFKLTDQHSVGGKNCGVLTSRRFCAPWLVRCKIHKSMLRLASISVWSAKFILSSVAFLQSFLQDNRFILLQVTTVCCKFSVYNHMNGISNQNRSKTFFCSGRLSWLYLTAKEVEKFSSSPTECIFTRNFTSFPFSLASFITVR